MSDIFRRRHLGLALVVGAGIIIAVASWRALAWSDNAFLGLVGGQACLALVATQLALRQNGASALAIVVAGALALRLFFLLQPPLLSDDVYRYVWDGRIANAGFNPYTHVPADPLLEGLRDEAIYPHLDKKDYAVTNYPAVAELLFVVVVRISDSLVAMKLAMLLCEAGAVLAMLSLLARLGRPRALIALYLLHPAPVWEIANNGHVDGAMMALFVAAFAWGAALGRPYRAGALLALGALIKPAAVFGLPAIWRPFDLRLPAFVIALALLCYAPFLSAGMGVFGFLPIYAREQGLESGTGFFLLSALRQLDWLRPWMRNAYLAGAAIILMTIALWPRGSAPFDLRRQLQRSGVLILTFLFLLTPVYPWYFLAVAPLVPLLGWSSAFVMMTTGFLLYSFNPDQTDFFARWGVSIGLIAAAVACDVWQARRPTETAADAA